MSALGLTPFLDVAHGLGEHNGQFEPRIFSFYLAKQNSQLRIGGTGDPDVFVVGSIEYHDLIPLDCNEGGQPIFSYFAVDGGRLSMTYSDLHEFGEAEIASGVQATIESGTNMILAPEEYVGKIYARISGFHCASSKHYVFPCGLSEAVFPAIRFQWPGGKEWTLTRER